MMLLFKANVVTDFLQIGIGEFLVKCKRFQTMKVAFLLPVFYKGLCLVEVDVRMVAQPLYATTVQVDEVDGQGVCGVGAVQVDKGPRRIFFRCNSESNGAVIACRRAV